MQKLNDKQLKNNELMLTVEELKEHIKQLEKLPEELNSQNKVLTARSKEIKDDALALIKQKGMRLSYIK